HCDINSAPLDVTNEQGNTVWSGKYERFGFVRSSPLSFYSDPDRKMESFEQNLRYAGQYFDNETGLHFNTFRFYDPQIGRFIMPDPIGLLGGINLYQYAPNPLGWIDPWGLTQALIYENPGHHEPGYLPGRQVPFNSSKSIIPPNAEELFKLSQLDPNDPKTSWVKIGDGKKAVWHRFQSSAADGSRTIPL
ncbi:RHS repeat domain-containing protein, partial [Providencia stuartii]